MRGRTTSMVEAPVTQNILGKNIVVNNMDINRRASLSNSSLNKMPFNEKLERYQVLLEKEYELRAKLSKEYGTPQCRHKHDTTIVCNCGRRLSATPTLATSSATNIGHATSIQHFQQQQFQSGHLTPPMHAVRYRSKSENIKRSERVRPLSADISLDHKSAAALRKIATEEKMGRRRDSLKSLQDDFDKAKSLIQRARASSNGNIQFDNNNNNTTAPHPITDNNNNKIDSQEKGNIRETPKRTSNDSGHFSSNESIASTSSQEMSNAVTNYIAVRRKERPLSSYL